MSWHDQEVICSTVKALDAVMLFSNLANLLFMTLYELAENILVFAPTLLFLSLVPICS